MLFTQDWFTHNVPHWEPILRPLKERSSEILEIGSYEGRSAVFFLEFLPRCRLTCVDPFNGDYTARFDDNVAPFGSRVTKIASRSVPALDRLQMAGRKFDVIYVDGAHERHNAWFDSVLSWQLLALGGILIWDDYRWKPESPAEERPEQAIDLFCAAFAPCLKELHRSYQVIVEKRAEWPATAAPTTPAPPRTAPATAQNWGARRLRAWRKGMQRFAATILAPPRRG